MTERTSVDLLAKIDIVELQWIAAHRAPGAPVAHLT